MPPRPRTTTTSPAPSSTQTSEPTEPTEPVDAPDPELTEEEWEKARKAILEALPEEKERPTNISARLAQVTGFIGQVRKSGWNAFHKYKFVKEGDLLEAIRPILSAYGIRIHQSLFADPDKGIIAHERRGQTTRDRDGNVTGEKETLTIVSMVFWFEWFNPETKTIEKTEPQIFMGYGDDNGDKGIYKALTGTEKYFLMKTFLVSTDSDPEADTRTDARAERQTAASSAPVRVSSRRGNADQPAPGGRQAESSESQTRMLGDLLRQNGIRSTADALAKISSLLGEEIPVDEKDPAASMTAFLTKLDGQKMGKLIHDLRAQTPATTPPAAQPPEATVAEDIATAQGEATDEPASAPDPEFDAGPAI